MGIKTIKVKGGVRFRVYWTEEGGRERKKMMPPGTTKEEAKEFLRDQQVRTARVKAGLEVRERNPRGLTVADVAKEWVKTCSKKDKNQITNHIINTPLGEMRLERVTKEVVKKHLDNLQPMPPTKGKKTARAVLSPRTKNHVRKHLRAIIERARDSGDLVVIDNPVAKVKQKKVTKKTLATYTGEECARLVNAVQQPWRGILAVALHGLRKGEIFGLDVVDVDVERNEIHVRRSYDNASTKTGQERTVSIIPHLRPAIVEAVELAEGRSVALFPGKRWPDKKKLNTSRRSENSSPAAAYRRAIRLAKIGRVIRFHDLRHTTATLLLQAGVAIQHVSKLLGHQDIRLTMNTYGHLLTDDLHKAVAKLSFELPAPRAVGDA